MKKLSVMILKSALTPKTFADSEWELFLLRLWAVGLVVIPTAFILGKGELGFDWFLAGAILFVSSCAAAGHWGQDLPRVLICGIAPDEVNFLGLSPHLVRKWSWKNANSFFPWLVAAVMVSLLASSLVSGADKMKMIKDEKGVITSQKVFFDFPGRTCQWAGSRYETIDGEKIDLVAEGKQFTVEVNLVPFATDVLAGQRWTKQQVLAVVAGQVGQVLTRKQDDEYGRLHAKNELRGLAVGPKGSYKLTQIYIYRR